MLLPSFIQAYEMVTCNSETLSDCVFYISNSLHIENYEVCKLERLNFEEGSTSQEEFYALTCPGAVLTNSGNTKKAGEMSTFDSDGAGTSPQTVTKNESSTIGEKSATCPYNKFFFKKSQSNNYQQNKNIQDFLSRNCLSEYCSRLVKSVGEVSLISQSVPVYYSVFPYVEGKTLSTIKKQMYSDGLNRKKLNILYRSIGFTLGSLHSAGMINNGVANDFLSLESHLVHGDLHSSNIIIKPDNVVIFVDIDGLYKSVTSARLLVNDIHTVTFQVLPAPMLLFDDHALSDWISAIPEFHTSFVDGYCSAITTIEHSECDSQIRKYMVKLLRSEYESFLTRDGSTSDDELEPVIYTNPYVLENRLRKLL